MGKLYLVKNCYHPNDAPTNRFLSYIEGFSQLGVEIEVVFVLSDSYNSKITEQLSNVKINYLWDKMNWKNRIMRIISYTILSKSFVKQLRDGDTVFLFDPQRMLYSLLKRKGIKVFAERTEHPYVVQSRMLNTKEYIEAGKKLDGLFVISTALKRFFVEEGYSKDKVHIVNMMVDSKRFEGLNKQLNKNNYIAYCGTASNNKDGVDELIKAFSIVHKRIPNIKLYIIGKPLDEQDESGNMRLVVDLGLYDSVVFTGIVPADEMPQMLKNAALLALDRPDSLQAQCGFPTKLGEYLLTQNPVVVTKVGDIPLFLEDGKTALLAEQRNPEEFASKMIWAIEHPEEAKKIGNAGAEVAMKEFNYLTETGKVAKVINRS